MIAIDLSKQQELEFITPIGIPTKEAKAEMERYPIIVEPKIRKCSI